LQKAKIDANLQDYADKNSEVWQAEKVLLEQKPFDHSEDFFDKIKNQNLLLVLLPVFLGVLLVSDLSYLF